MSASRKPLRTGDVSKPHRLTQTQGGRNRPSAETPASAVFQVVPEQLHFSLTVPHEFRHSDHSRQFIPAPGFHDDRPVLSGFYDTAHLLNNQQTLCRVAGGLGHSSSRSCEALYA